MASVFGQNLANVCVVAGVARHTAEYDGLRNGAFMGNKARHRTIDWKKRVAGYLLAEQAQNAIEELNFRRLKDLGIIREEK